MRQSHAPFARPRAVRTPESRCCGRLAILILLVGDCGLRSVAAATPVPMTLRVDSIERSAVVYPAVGEIPDAGHPLVLMFHGHGGNAGRQARKHAIHAHWPEAVVVYPQGLPGIPRITDPQGVRSGWQMRPGQAEDRDLHFVDRLLEEIPKRYPIDPARIYAAGHSNGGRFAAVLWSARPDRFAAFASGCGQGGRWIRGAQPKPVMMIMGESDRIVPIRGQLRSVELARELLATNPAVATRDGYLTRENGVDGLELVTYIHPGGHEWPAESTPHLVEFFKRHALPAPGLAE